MATTDSLGDKLIRIIGETSSKDMDAAKALRELIVTSDPRIIDNHLVEMYLIPGVQCFGQSPRDIDLTLISWDSRVSEKLSETSSGRKIRSLCLTIELKGHSSKDVWFEGEKCYVRYNSKPHDVTIQSEKQKYSLHSYLKGRSPKGKSPYIENLIWLTNVPSREIPNELNILGSDSTWQDFLDTIARVSNRKDVASDYQYVSFTSKPVFESTKGTLTKRIEPSRIDRRKMEQITRDALKLDQGYVDKIGEQLLILRGRGGTGKTVRLLRLAYKLYTEKLNRVLILTYNKALVADLTRLLTLLGIKDALAGPSIQIRTIHSFMYEWLNVLGVLDKSGAEGFLSKYELLKQEALSFIQQGAISEEDTKKSIAAHSRSFAWDVVMIDESQDWPESERDLLYKLYPPNSFVLADGVDQLVRDTKLINWRESLPPNVDSQVVPLRKSLRLKSDLCRFVSKFADAIDYGNWDLQPVPEAHGGRVLVYTGNPFNRSILTTVLSSSKEDRNMNVDNLICVPPSYVTKGPTKKFSTAADEISRWGYSIWDGVDSEVRDSFPEDLNDLRIVQYDSCRGLEGWAVINLAFDEFFESKRSRPQIDERARQDIFFDEDKAALEFAKRWMMIPLTRAIDTLVIHISDKDSYIGEVLAGLRSRYPEVIEWIEGE